MFHSRIRVSALSKSVLELLNNSMGSLEPSRNRVVVPARQATWAGGIDPLKSMLGLLKSLKIQADFPSLPSSLLPVRLSVHYLRISNPLATTARYVNSWAQIPVFVAISFFLSVYLSAILL